MLGGLLFWLGMGIIFLALPPVKDPSRAIHGVKTLSWPELPLGDPGTDLLLLVVKAPSAAASACSTANTDLGLLPPLHHIFPNSRSPYPHTVQHTHECGEH